MKTQYFLTFRGDAAVRALGRRLKEGDRIKIKEEQARQFKNPRAKALGIRIVKVDKSVKKKKEVNKSWPKK